MRKPYFILAIVILIASVLSVFAYRQFSSSLFPASPTPSSSPSPSPYGLKPSDVKIPEVKNILDKVDADKSNLTCKTNADCNWYSAQVNSTSDNKAHSLQVCGNKLVKNTCTDCSLADPKTTQITGSCTCDTKLCTMSW